MSAKNASQSSNISASFIYRILSVIKFNFKEFDYDKQQLLIAEYQFFIRKAAHFSIYAALGFFSFGFFSTYDSLKPVLSVFISAVFIVFYSALDEFHQLFVEGRSGQFSDVLLDTFGGICGILVMLILFKLFKARRNNEI